MYEIIDKQDWHNCDRLELALQQFVLSSFSELDAMWVKAENMVNTRRTSPAVWPSQYTCAYHSTWTICGRV